MIPPDTSMLAAGDGSGGCAAGVLVAVLAVAGILFSNAKKKSRVDVLAGLASRWNGEAHPGDLFSNPSLRIRVDGIEGEVTFQESSKNRPAWTQVHFDWPTSHRLRVTPEGIGSMFKSMIGSAETSVGDPAFDAHCWVESSDEAWAREVLAADVREAILEIPRGTAWFQSGNFSLDLGSAGLRLRVSRMLVDDAAGLGRFVETAILVLRQARNAGAPSGVILAAVETKPRSECPVCGHAVTERKKDCPDCRTPHHDDCWAYSGGCAIFGCVSRGRKST